jgi:hypothetical protein
MVVVRRTNILAPVKDFQAARCEVKAVNRAKVALMVSSVRFCRLRLRFQTVILV